MFHFPQSQFKEHLKLQTRIRDFQFGFHQSSQLIVAITFADIFIVFYSICTFITDHRIQTACILSINECVLF